MVKSMKSRNHGKIKKTATNAKIRKKKQTSKSMRFWGFNNNVSIQNLENINETLRITKTQRAEGRSSWELVPKDSIEVYKERRRKRETQDSNDDNQERPKRGKARPKVVEKKVKKPVKKTRKNKRRSQSYTPEPSQASCSSCSHSCNSGSDMEY